MSVINTLTRASQHLQTLRKTTFLATAAASLALAGPASAANSIGLHFMTGADNGATNGARLAATAVAGATAYAQGNWNNLSGQFGTNVIAIDSSGASSGVSVNWSANNTWSQTGNTTATLGTPDLNLMNPYLDNTGNANVAIANPFNMYSTTVPVNANRNWPLVYLTNMVAWMASQSVAAYDIVIYFDGDNNGGRTGEYWPVAASGTPVAMTVGADAATHVFGCDLNNFANGGNQIYTEVPGYVQSTWLPNLSGGFAAEYLALAANYTVLKSLTNDAVLLRTQRFNSRAPINAVQIIPRATPLLPALYGLNNAPVYAGGKAVFSPSVVGATPMTFQWQKNGAALSDSGNIAGSSTSRLTVTNASGGDAASYALVVSNAFGSITSAPAALTIVAPVVDSYPYKIATNFPYAYWRFNESADPSTGFAPAYDYVGGFTAAYGMQVVNGFNGVVGPTPTDFPGFESGNLAYQSANPASGRSINYLMAPPLNINSNVITVCAWIYPTAAQAGFTALISSRNGNDVFAFGYGNNNNLGYTWNSNNASTYNFASGLVPLTNAWSFVALSISPSNAICYLYNPISVSNGLYSATNVLASTNTQPCAGPTFIGGDVQGSSIAVPTSRSFVGSIDELAIFNRTVSPTEIYNLYKKAIGVSALGVNLPGQPASLALYQGRTATFNVVATGQDTPITYQWRKNGQPMSNGGNTNGVSTSTLTISNVNAATDPANYDVVVANIVGAVTSTVATLTVVSSNAFPTPYEAKIRADNPVAFWRLNETNGSPYSYDYWGGNIATNENVVMGVAGPIPPNFTGVEPTNTCGQFDGLTADIATSASLLNNLAQFSVIGWFNTAGTIGQRVGLFGQNDAVEFGFHANGPDGQAQLGVWTPRAAAFLNQSTNVIPGNWYLIAAVASGTNVSLYLASTNGGGGIQVVQSITPHAATTNYGSSTFPFRIGGGGVLDPTGNYFTGLIDEVAIFNRAISVGELSDLFGAALNGGDLPPTISSEPSSLTLYAGRTATFSVSALGTSPTYQWRSNGIPIVNGGKVSGATTLSLTISNISAANQAAYDLVITNHAGSITSVVATLTVITPESSFESAVIAANPLAYYRLNETNDPSTGPVSHDYWGGHNGVYGTATLAEFNGIQGPIPPDFLFESTNAAIELSAIAGAWVTAPIGSLSTNTVTMCMWIRPTSSALDPFTGLLMNRNSGVSGGFGYANGAIGYTWNNNSAATYGFNSGLIPPTNIWSFVALVVEPARATVYMLNDSGMSSATNVLAHNSDVFGNNWQIGRDNNANADDGSRTFIGDIDEVAVFTYSMTPTQIQNLYLSVGTLPVTLTIQTVGSSAVVTWPSGTLLEAPTPNGPWTTNSAPSPYSFTPNAAQKYFKVRVR